MTRPPPRPPLFPYTTLFRSAHAIGRIGPAMQRVRLLFRRKAKRLAPYHDGGLLQLLFRIEIGLQEGHVVGGHIGVEERSEEHTSELQSLRHLVCRLLLEKKK